MERGLERAEFDVLEVGEFEAVLFEGGEDRGRAAVGLEEEPAHQALRGVGLGGQEDAPEGALGGLAAVGLEADSALDGHGRVSVDARGAGCVALVQSQFAYLGWVVKRIRAKTMQKQTLAGGSGSAAARVRRGIPHPGGASRCLRALGVALGRASALAGA